MHHIDILQQVFSSDAALADDARISPTRRSLLVASLLAAPVTAIRPIVVSVRFSIEFSLGLFLSGSEG